MAAKPSKVLYPLAFLFAAWIMEFIPSQTALVIGMAAVLPFKRCCDLLDATVITFNSRTFAVNIARIEQAVSMTP